jgi:hypothetical protein
LPSYELVGQTIFNLRKEEKFSKLHDVASDRSESVENDVEGDFDERSGNVIRLGIPPDGDRLSKSYGFKNDFVATQFSFEGLCSRNKTKTLLVVLVVVLFRLQTHLKITLSFYQSVYHIGD